MQPAPRPPWLSCKLAGAVLAMLGALHAAPAGAGPKVREQGGERRVEGKTYSAVVAADGCLTGLEAGGTQLLAAGVGVSRGGYVFQDGIQALTELSAPRRDTVLAQGALASVRYDFEDDGLVLTVKNRTARPLRYFLVLAAEVRGVRLGVEPAHLDALGKAPRQTTDARGVWFGGGARLTVKDPCGGWGPWMERHQVLDLEVPGGGERTLALEVAAASDAERSALEALLAPPPELDLAVLHPRPWQVLQRDARGGADVRVNVRVLLETAVVEVRLTGGPESPNATPPASPWTALSSLPRSRSLAGTSFAGSLRVAQGAGYVLEVRARTGTILRASLRVEPLGVGEVFVIAGQSNSTNSGEERQKPASGRVSTFDGQSWRAADDPQPGCHDKSQGGSPWPAFGDLLVERLGVPVGIACTGHAGTSVVAWEPGGELQRWLMARVHELGPQGFRALLWHQGESDVGMRAAEYHARLLTLIRATRLEAGWDVPWGLARVSYHSPNRSRFESTRGAQQQLIDEGAAFEGPDTDTLTGEHRDLGGQGIHFSAKGLTAHGRLWGVSVLHWLEQVVGPPTAAR